MPISGYVQRLIRPPSRGDSSGRRQTRGTIVQSIVTSAIIRRDNEGIDK